MRTEKFGFEKLSAILAIKIIAPFYCYRQIAGIRCQKMHVNLNLNGV